MPWTTPATFTAGSVLTAAQLNTNVRDNTNWLRALGNIQSTTVTASTATTTSSTFADVPSLTVAVTPTFSDSKILVSGMLTHGHSTGQDTYFQLVRVIGTASTTVNSTNVHVMAYSALVAAPNLTYFTANAHFEHLDSPATTSVVTYKVQWRTTGATAYLNRRGVDTNNNAFSSITVREVPQ